MPAAIEAVYEDCLPQCLAGTVADMTAFTLAQYLAATPFPRRLTSSRTPLLPSKNAWQSRKNIVNLTADVMRIKASAEQFEDQAPACLQAWSKLLPAISCTLSLGRSLSHSKKAG